MTSPYPPLPGRKPRAGAVKLQLQQIVKRYVDYAWTLRIDLRLFDGEIMTLLGPSGCGKTTTLRIIAGFIQPDSGDVLLDQRLITTVPTYRRNFGVVFQDYALFPHKTVFDNIAFGMQMKRRYSKRQIHARVTDLLALVGLEGYAARYPDQLSGGEQQRIALLRAIAPHPAVLLLDEPLSALDFQLRKRLRREIKKVQRSLSITMLYVTHDQEEAMSISDRITVMRDGRVEQVGAPVEIYQHPRTAYVAQFVGMSNLITGTIRGREQGRFRVQAGPHTFLIPEHPDYTVHDPITFFFRPEDAFLSHAPAGENVLRGRIREHEYLGAEILTSVETPEQQVYVVSNYIKNEIFVAHEGQEVCLNVAASGCKIIGSQPPNR
jgi:ABC-type Fe3+/spermidine/putrescine transport system ATPase subunit